MAPLRLPSLPPTAMAPQEKAALLARYGDLTRGTSVLPEVLQTSRLLLGVAHGRARESDEFVTRRELQEKLAFLEHRMELLTNTVRQQAAAARRVEDAVRALEQRGARSRRSTRGEASVELIEQLAEPTAAPLGVGRSGFDAARGADGDDDEEEGTEEEEEEEADAALEGIDRLAAGEAYGAAAGEAYGAGDVEPPEREVGETGVVSVSSDGVAHVELELQYEQPVVLATLLSTGSSGAAPAVSIPTKDGTSFTVQLSPPPRGEQEVAYLVLEAGAHVLGSGSTLIAAESAAFLGEELTVKFEMSFAAPPAVLCCQQGVPASASARACVGELGGDGFSLRLAEGRRPRRWAAEGEAPPLPAAGGEERAEEMAVAATRLQARQRGKMARALLQPKHESVVGWVAAQCSGGDGLVTGVAELHDGEWVEVQFNIEYPEPPIVITNVASGSLTDESSAFEILCDRRANNGIWLQYRANGASEQPDAVRVLWMALPAGKLWALEQYEDDDRMTVVTSTAVS
ncbi:hypothetical protein AB1Y20_015896 [Prymnesium parvum]|uniref:Coatomer subunit delta n=1 Tax=Prymnesium parvum TaxID=97485 RepID=A0AB34K1S2_PRYPA